MRKLNLLKPNLCTGYLDGGTSQKVEYLQLDGEVSLDCLKADVELGATQFQECLQQLQKGCSRFVIIDCNTKEEGLMAVSYLAEAGLQKEDTECEDEGEPAGFIAAEELSGGSGEDIFRLDDVFTDDEWEDCEDFDLEEEPDDADDEEDSAWEESPSRLPVVLFSEIAEYTDRSNAIGRGPFQMMQDFHMGEKPYWTGCRHEPICILRYANSYPQLTTSMDSLKRFSENRNVYFLHIRRSSFESFFGGCEVQDDRANQELLRLALMFTADIIHVDGDRATYAAYEELLFDGWLSCFSYRVAKAFPKHEIIKKITEINTLEPSQTMEKVMRYIGKDGSKKTLTKKDFDFLQKFVGAGTEEKDPISRLEQDLVGMENVKRQIREIVQMMKFTKYRQEAGLGKGNFHNVHLLIGAPGTAKTTVARLMGEIMCKEQLLPGNRFASVNGADLKGLYVGHSAPKTHQLFERNDIIFIDEAYSIVSDKEPDSFSQEALAQLVIELEEHAMDKLVIFAGYGGREVSEKNNKMKLFIDSNPGIKSRINSTIFFDSYNAGEMLRIVHSLAAQQKFVLTGEADSEIIAYFAKRVKYSNFGNGREARSFLEHIIMQAAVRLSGQELERINKRKLAQLTKEDVRGAIARMEQDNLMQRGKTKNQLGFIGTTA